MRHKERLITVAVALTMSLSLAGAPAAFAQEAAGDEATSSPSVVPAGEAPLGIRYEEWAARWWQWMLSTPAAENPGGMDNCQAGQGGEVFYIAHAAPGATLQTTCSVGADQHILATGGATIYDISECGGTEEGGRACIQADLEADPAIFSNVSVSVDGEEVSDIDSFRVISPIFEVEYIEGNIYGSEPGASKAMIGGWFVMIEPLPPGCPSASSASTSRTFGTSNLGTPSTPSRPFRTAQPSSSEHAAAPASPAPGDRPTVCHGSSYPCPAWQTEPRMT